MYVKVLVYAAKLAEDDASIPVTWWYTPILTPAQSLSPEGILQAISYHVTYLFRARLDRLLDQMYQIGWAQLAETLEAVGPYLDN